MKNLIAALSLSLVSLSAAAEPPTDDSIRTLFSVMKAESMSNDMMAAMTPMMRQGMEQAAAGKALSTEQKAAMDRFSLRLGQFMQAEMSWAKLEPMQIRIYRDTFEQAEIDGLIEFYRSPIGQSYTKKMPVTMQKVMAEMQAYMQQVLPKMQAIMQELAAEMKTLK